MNEATVISALQLAMVNAVDFGFLQKKKSRREMLMCSLSVSMRVQRRTRGSGLPVPTQALHPQAGGQPLPQPIMSLATSDSLF